MSRPPVADTGRPITLPVGGEPAILTEYAVGDPPLFIVNTSTDLAWIGSDTSVGPGNGVPLEPGTALPWTGTGVVYGAADQGAANPIGVYITSAIAGWNPSPAAIAAQVAAALLATGIPNVLLEETVAAGDVIPAGNQKIYQVGGFASLALSLKGTRPAVPLVLFVQWRTAAGVVVDQDYLYAFTDGTHDGQLFARLAVEASQLVISNITPSLIPPAPTDITLTMTGSNRPAQRRIDTRSSSTAGGRFAYAGVIAAAGVVTMLPDSDLDAQLSGLATATFKITGAATGRFDLVTGADTGSAVLHTVTVCDSKEMITNAAGNLYLCRQIVLPESGFGFQFNAVAGQAGGSVTVDLLI